MIKLVAMGNILMEDDGIAIVVAELLKEQLTRMGIQVICGETDTGYCIANLTGCDYLILLDATSLGKEPGRITRMPLQNQPAAGGKLSQHGILLTNLLHIYFPQLQGVLLGIETAGISFCRGLSPKLADRLEDITKEILNIIRDILQRNELCQEG